MHNVYVHPSTCLYVLIGQDGIIRMYDITTMSIVGSSMRKLTTLNESRFCVFT